MSEHLLKAGANITPREGDELARLPYLRTWFRTRSAIILHLSNGCVQINFFQVSLAGRGCEGRCLSGGLGQAGNGRCGTCPWQQEGSGMRAPNQLGCLPSVSPTYTAGPSIHWSPSVLPSPLGPHQAHPVPADGRRHLHQ